MPDKYREGGSGLKGWYEFNYKSGAHAGKDFSFELVQMDKSVDKDYYVDDVKQGIIASKIAAHAADIAKGLPGATDWDLQMDKARKVLDWEKMFDVAIDPEKARRYRESSKPEKEDTCSMCGNFCAVKNMNRILDGEIVSIFDE